MMTFRPSPSSVSALILAIPFPLSAATMITQGGGEDFLAFEAETFTARTELQQTDQEIIVIDTSPTLTTAFGTDALPAGTNASGGSALLSLNESANFANRNTRIEYELVFSEPGTYLLYHRYSAFEQFGSDTYGAENSYFLSTTLGGTANQQQGLPIGTVNPQTDPLEGTYVWQSTSRSYTITAGDVGVPLVFRIEDRERGVSLDRFVFSQETTLDEAGLNALANSAVVPEPSVALLVLSSLAGYVSIRRCRVVRGR